MNTNEHEYYFGLVSCSAAIFLLPFVNIRVHSWLKFFSGAHAMATTTKSVSASKVYLHASYKLSGMTAGARLILRQRLLLHPELRFFSVYRARALFRQSLEIMFGLVQIAEPMPARAESRQQLAARVR